MRKSKIELVFPLYFRYSFRFKLGNTNSKMSSAYQVKVPQESATHDAVGWVKEDHLEKLTKELKDFCKCVKGKPDMFFALTDFGAISGHQVDPSCCKPVEGELIQEILRDFVMIVVDDVKVNGKLNNWNTGFLGNRWLDMNARSYGVDHIRFSFKSKKLDGQDKWKSDKPYQIVGMIERAR